MSRGDFSFAFNDAYDPVEQITDPEGRMVWEACIDPGDYSYTRTDSTLKYSPIRGRPRFRLKDTRQTFRVNCTMQLTNSQFNEWQTYWTAVAERGGKPFWMRLRLDALQPFLFLSETYEVTALQPWEAQLDVDGFWRVRLQVEAPWNIGFLATLCDEIYGGPITTLAVDEIYGGPIDALATDIIAPCEAVLG